MQANFILMHVHGMSYIDLMVMVPWEREIHLTQVQHWEAEKIRLQKHAESVRNARGG